MRAVNESCGASPHAADGEARRGLRVKVEGGGAVESMAVSMKQAARNGYARGSIAYAGMKSVVGGVELQKMQDKMEVKPAAVRTMSSVINSTEITVLP